MFTGIIQSVGQVIEAKDAGLVVGMHEDFVCSKHYHRAVDLGDSIAINGCCLTVTKIEKNVEQQLEKPVRKVGKEKGAYVAYFDLGSETLALTTLGKFIPGQKVNMERALIFGQGLDGHVVTGHVDTKGKIESLTQSGKDEFQVEISCSSQYEEFLLMKGSICIDGVSLTLNTIYPAQDDDNVIKFSVNIIPFTWKHTVFNAYKKGIGVNLEFDASVKQMSNLFKKYIKKIENRN